MLAPFNNRYIVKIPVYDTFIHFIPLMPFYRFAQDDKGLIF